MRVSTADATYRYLAAFGTTDGPFISLLGDLEIRRTVSLEEAVSLGWITPVLRVPLPKRFFMDWKSYPNFPREGTLHAQDRWVSYLLGLTGSARASAVPWRERGRTDGWWNHVLDTPEHELTQVVRRRAVGTRARLPEAFEHPRGGRHVRPWVDFFAYWQAYEFADVLNASTLYDRRIHATPSAASRLRAMAKSVPTESEFAEIRLGRAKRQWEARRPVFDWLSRYRTLLGIWLEGPTLPFEHRDQATQKLAAQLGLTADVLGTAIRDVLLVMWREWNPPRRDHQLSKASRVLQQDIARATELWELISEEPFDASDPFWGRPADLQARFWTPLPEALPYEAPEAKEDFSRSAMLYLQPFNAHVPGPLQFTEDSIASLVAKHWDDSIALRRLVVAFARLHEHYGGEINKDNLVGLRAQTPIEFLILSTLHVEKLLSGQHGTLRFSPLVKAAAARVWKRHQLTRSPSVSAELERVLKSRTNLDQLPTTQADPFLKKGDVNTGNAEADHLVCCLTNFAIMRNYSAHHDCLDEELIYGELAEPAIEAILVVALTCLDTWQ